MYRKAFEKQCFSEWTVIKSVIWDLQDCLLAALYAIAVCSVHEINIQEVPEAINLWMVSRPYSSRVLFFLVRKVMLRIFYVCF